MVFYTALGPHFANKNYSLFYTSCCFLLLPKHQFRFCPEGAYLSFFLHLREVGPNFGSYFSIETSNVDVILLRER